GPAGVHAASSASAARNTTNIGRLLVDDAVVMPVWEARAFKYPVKGSKEVGVTMFSTRKGNSAFAAPGLLPIGNRTDDRDKLAALVCQAVHDTRRHLRVQRAREQAVALERLQAGCNGLRAAFLVQSLQLSKATLAAGECDEDTEADNIAQ